MKCFERLILSHILPHVQSQLDPYQFAYRSRRGTDDAIACLLHKLFEHMETAGNYARILFIDFSSAFNTIQRHVMIDKLQKLEVPAALVHWVFNFLSNHPQCVRVGDIKSPVLVSNTGAPQGCVLSPFLYTLYTNDCRRVDSSTQFVIQPCSLFWMILPHTRHIFLQWYVSLVGAVTIFCIWMFPKWKKCASTSVVIELSLVLLSSTVNLWNRLIHSNTSVLY